MQKMQSANETKYSLNNLLKASTPATLSNQVTSVSIVNDFNTTPNLKVQPLKESFSKYFVFDKDELNKLTNEFSKLEKSLKLMSKSFVNQRKMYIYTKAWNSYQNEYITDEELDAIEEKVTISIDNNYSLDEVNHMISILFENIDNDDIEEFDIEELSSILGVSRDHVLQITNKLYTELKSK